MIYYRNDLCIIISIETQHAGADTDLFLYRNDLCIIISIETMSPASA